MECSAAEAGVNRHALDVSATLLEAYDTHLVADAGSSPTKESVSGFYTMLHSGAQYAWTSSSVTVALAGTSALAYYGQVGEVQPVGYSGAASLAAPLGRRRTISINQTAHYQPSFRVGLFLDDAVNADDGTPGTPDYAIGDVASQSYRTNASLKQGLSRDVSITARAEYRFTGFMDAENPREDRSSAGVAVALGNQVGRNTSVNSGYRFRTDAGAVSSSPRGDGTNDATIEHNVNFALQHSRPLSATRRASFNFRLGVSAIDVPPGRLTGIAGRLYRVTGNGAFTYPVSRSWRVQASYRRGLDYVAELADPVFADSFGASLAGLLTRRLDLTVSGAYSNGGSVMSTSSNFDTYSANVRSLLAISSQVAAYFEYLYYFYDFGQTTLTGPGVPPQNERNGIRVGISFWMRPLER